MKLKDIAEICGVSIATVSKVVNGKTSDIGAETIERIEAVLKEYNYIPNGLARSMKTNRSYSIGLIIPDVRNPFFTEIARGAEDMAYKNGYTLFLSNSDDDFNKEKKYIQSHLEKRVDGILLIGSHERLEEEEKNMNLDIPIVTIDRPSSYRSIVGEVSTDNYLGAKEAAQYLLELGHSKFLYVGGSPLNTTNCERKHGLLDSIQNENNNVLVDVVDGSFTFEHGYDSIMNLQAIPYTAIFCANDMIAFGVIKALSDKGLQVPEDISVVGVDDITFARTSNPSLTTVRQPSYELGQLGAQMLIKSITHNKSKQNNLVLKQELVIRSSTTKAPQ